MLLLLIVNIFCSKVTNNSNFENSRVIFLAQKNDLKGIRNINLKNRDLSLRDSKGLGAIHHATRNMNGVLLQMLLEAGADLLLPDSNNMNVIDYALDRDKNALKMIFNAILGASTTIGISVLKRTVDIRDEDENKKSIVLENLFKDNGIDTSYAETTHF